MRVNAGTDATFPTYFSPIGDAGRVLRAAISVPHPVVFCPSPVPEAIFFVASAQIVRTKLYSTQYFLRTVPQVRARSLRGDLAQFTPLANSLDLSNSRSRT